MDKIVAAFNATFATWDIQLPLEHVALRKRGELKQAGWFIRYLFGTENGTEYLDYYAMHSMTNDRHVRIYAGGRVDILAAHPEFRLSSADPVEDARLQAEYIAEGRRVTELLKRKGF